MAGERRLGFEPVDREFSGWATMLRAAIPATAKADD